MLLGVYIDNYNINWPICHILTCMTESTQLFGKHVMTDMPLTYNNDELCNCGKFKINHNIPWYYNGDLSSQLRSFQDYEGQIKKIPKDFCL